jgi:hypothetical protein
MSWCAPEVRPIPQDGQDGRLGRGLRIQEAIEALAVAVQVAGPMRTPWGSCRRPSVGSGHREGWPSSAAAFSKRRALSIAGIAGVGNSSLRGPSKGFPPARSVPRRLPATPEVPQTFSK